MRTQMLGNIDIDESAIRRDLERSREFHFSEQYPEFQSGHSRKTCMLWSAGGRIGDGTFAHYDVTEPTQPTAYGNKLPYLRELVESSVAVEHLLFARMVIMTDVVLLPHRDDVASPVDSGRARPRNRLHIPLSTSEDCLFMENNTVYRMSCGEFWSLDVTQIHSAAVLSNTNRVHLIMDFADVAPQELLKIEQEPSTGIPERNIVQRPPLTSKENDAIRALQRLADEENLTQLFGIIVRKSFRRDCGENFAWETMMQIAHETGNAKLIGRVSELHKLCTREEV